MIYWPGTNIVKSNGNAFTSWKKKPETTEKKQSVVRQIQTNGLLYGKDALSIKKSFTIYSKA